VIARRRLATWETGDVFTQRCKPSRTKNLSESQWSETRTGAWLCRMRMVCCSCFFLVGPSKPRSRCGVKSLNACCEENHATQDSTGTGRPKLRLTPESSWNNVRRQWLKAKRAEVDEVVENDLRSRQNADAHNFTLPHGAKDVGHMSCGLLGHC
jgi:hypothetical protein